MSYFTRFAKSIANARVSDQMLNILMPKCRVDQVSNIRRQIRDHYESGALDDITMSRDSPLKVKQMREMLLIGLESRIGPITTSVLIGCSSGTICAEIAFGQPTFGLFLVSFLGFSCWVDSL